MLNDMGLTQNQRGLALLELGSRRGRGLSKLNTPQTNLTPLSSSFSSAAEQPAQHS